MVRNGKLNLIAQKETRGAVYNLASLNESLIAGINSRVQMYDWIEKDDGSWALEPVCSHAGQVLALYFDVRGDTVLVGKYPPESRFQVVSQTMALYIFMLQGI